MQWCVCVWWVDGGNGNLSNVALLQHSAQCNMRSPYAFFGIQYGAVVS